MLEKEFNITNFVLTIRVIGKADIEEIVQIIKDEYPRAKGGVIWDFTQGDISNLDADKFRRIAKTVTEVSIHKKTAYVGGNALQFGMARMYENYAELENVAPKMRVCRNMEQAIEWVTT